MKRGVSLYLDVVRFTAALMVFIGHVSGQLFTGGLFWQGGLYLQAAVMVFFVLSGYVIAYVLNERERTPLQFVSARIARLYSVIIPALILTAACDALGLWLNPSFYYDGPWGYPGDAELPRYLATLLLVNQSWWWGKTMEPGINQPFWSLSFEAAYYLAAGLMFFVRGHWRVVLCGVLAVLAGPVIVVLSLNWFLGYGIYHLTRRIRLSQTSGWVVSGLGLLLLIMAPLVRGMPGGSFTFMGRNLLADYYEGFSFGIHLIGIHFISGSLETVLSRPERLVRRLGSLTFALYLFHRPLVQVLAVLNIGAPESWQQRVYIIGATLLIVATLGSWCEAQKSTIRKAILGLGGSRPTGAVKGWRREAWWRR